MNELNMENRMLSKKKCFDEFIKNERKNIIELEKRLGSSGVPKNKFEEFIKNERENIIGNPINKFEDESDTSKKKSKRTTNKSILKQIPQIHIPDNLLKDLRAANLISNDSLQWIAAVNLCAYFVDKYFSNFSNMWSIGEDLFNVRNLAQSKDHYFRHNKSGKPKKSDIIDDIIEKNKQK